MFCSKCGNQINLGEKFCSSCGNMIEVIEPTQPEIEIPKSPDKKKLHKENLVKVGIIAIITIVLFVFGFLGGTAPEREMKKALETDDYYTVISTYESLLADGEEEKANMMLNDYINDAIIYFNENFSMSLVDISNYGEIYDEVLDFLYENYGDIFVNYYEEEYSLGGILNSGIYDIDASLYDFREMVESKVNYYEGLFNKEYLYGNDEDYDRSIVLSRFYGVIEEDVNYESAQEKVKEVYDEYINYLISKADEYMANGDYSATIELLNNAIEELNDEYPNDDIKSKIDDVLSSYATQYATKAEEEFKNGDINAAIGNIEAAISICPNGEYEGKLEEYKLYLPLALYNKENFLSYKYGEGGFSYEESVVGNDNKKYNNVIIIDSYVAKDYWKSDASDLAFTCEYNLAGKYDLVSGLMLMAKDNQNQKYNTYFKAYGDGKLLYTSPSLKSGDLPETISFDVSGVQKLKLEFYIEISQYNYVSADMYISDLVAQKNIPTDTTE